MKLASGSNNTSNLTHLNELKFSDIANNLSKSSRIFDNQSIRLIYHNKGEAGETATLKVHKSITNRIKDGSARKEKRMEAREHVKRSIQNEFKLSNSDVESLLAKVGVKHDRISLSDVKKLSQEIKHFADSKAIWTSLRSSEIMGDFQKVMSMTKQPLLFGEIAEVKKMLADISDAKSPKELRKALKAFEETIDNTLDLKWAQRQQTPTKDKPTPQGFYDIVNKEFRKTVRGELQKLRDEALKGYCAKTEQSLVPIKLTGLKTHFDHNKVSDFKNGSLKDLLKVSQDKWEASEQGATCSLVVKDPSIPGSGAIIKIEQPHLSNAANDIATYIDHVSSKINLPIDGMMVKIMETDEQSLTKMGEIVKGTKNDRAQANLKSLESVAQGKAVVTKAMFLEGVSDFKDLSLPQRIQLVESNHFPQSLGSVMVLGQLFGLGDHIGIEGSRAGEQTNLANLMINTTNGRLALIDYTYFRGGRKFDPENPKSFVTIAHEKTGIEDKAPLSGFGSDILVENFRLVTNHIKDIAKNPAMFDTLFSGGILEKDGRPLSNALRSVFQSGTEGSLFSTTEAGMINSITLENKKKFIFNLCLGIIDSMKLIAENTEAFGGSPNKRGGDEVDEKPFPVTMMFDNPNTVLGEIQNLAKDIDQVRESIAKLVV